MRGMSGCRGLGLHDPQPVLGAVAEEVLAEADGEVRVVAKLIRWVSWTRSRTDQRITLIEMLFPARFSMTLQPPFDR